MRTRFPLAPKPKIKPLSIHVALKYNNIIYEYNSGLKINILYMSSLTYTIVRYIYIFNVIHNFIAFYAKDITRDAALPVIGTQKKLDLQYPLV